MNAQEIVLARKYACAYVDIYGSSWNIPQIHALIEFSRMFHERRTVPAYLRVSCIPEQEKVHILLKSLAHFKLDKLLEPMVNLLAHHNRLELFGVLLHALRTFLEQIYHMEEITIRTAAPLTDVHRRAIVAWIEQITEKHIYAYEAIDTRLIAGIRLEGKSFFWEHSIHQQLRRIASIC
jgi:ATP synthase F1 delta subunit